LLDENLSPRLADLLRAAGHHVIYFALRATTSITSVTSG
jgi:predicted nuclease of predicted toxin-antitoxin system